MMANYVYQLDNATGYPDICLHIILNVQERVFSDGIKIWIGRLNNADCPPQHGRVLSNQWSPE